jgi:hypothetical protein
MRGMIAGLAAVLSLALPMTAEAQSAANSGLPEDQYRPAIWIDPDGCQHWVMDDGQRGFMDPVRTKDGKPVCLRGTRAENDPVFPVPDKADSFRPAIWIDPDGCQHWAMDERGRGFMDLVLDRAGRPICGRPAPVCGNFAADQLFATASAAIPPSERARLAEFFRAKGATTVQIAGHTDSRGGAASNMFAASFGYRSAVLHRTWRWARRGPPRSHRSRAPAGRRWPASCLSAKPGPRSRTRHRTAWPRTGASKFPV